jgi:hypothetical protein
LTDFGYLLQVYTTDAKPAYAEKINLPMYPSELKYRVFVNIPVAYGKITRAELVALPVSGVWQPIAQFAKPSLPIREVKSVPTSKYLVVTGIVRNDNVFPMRQLTVNVFLDDASGKLASASKTIVNDLLASEEREFQAVLLLPADYSSDSTREPKIVVDGVR